MVAVCSRNMSGSSGKDPVQETGGDKVYVEAVLNRHAQKLLSAFRLHDLAFFAANLQDYELVGWLRKERYAEFLAVASISTLCLKKWSTKLIAVTLSNFYGFSKFFH